MTIHLWGSMIITTRTRLFSSCLSIYVFLIASVLYFPRPVYVLLPELLSVNKLYWKFDDFFLFWWVYRPRRRLRLKKSTTTTKTKQNKRTSLIQVEETTQTITHLVEEACLLKFVKLWKLRLISLRVLMTMHLLRSTIWLLTQEIVSSCLSIIFLIASLFFSRPVYACFSELISVNNIVIGFAKRESVFMR